MNLLRDVHHGLRGLRGSLGLTLVIVTVLGIGIGSNVAVFTVIDAAFLRPLRLPEQSESVRSAVVQKLATIGEAAARISEEVKCRYPVGRDMSEGRRR